MDREELHRRVFLIRDALRDGKLFFSTDTKNLQESLLKVRIADDGLVDEDSVDGLVRALGITMAHQDFRNKAREAISLREIQETYVAIVRHTAGQLHDIMTANGVNSSRLANWFITQDGQVDRAYDYFTELTQTLAEFWEDTGESAWVHVEDSHAVKAVYGGSFFPQNDVGTASLSGVYSDTLIVPDPISRAARIFKHGDKRDFVRELVRISLDVLSRADHILADSDPPLMVVLPDRDMLDGQHSGHLVPRAQRDATSHLSQVFARKFASPEEAYDFLKTFEPHESLVAEIVDHSRFFMGIDGVLDPAQQIREYRERWGDFPGLPSLGPGELVWSQATSRMGQANDLMDRARRVRGFPVLDFDASWRWLQFMVEASPFGEVPDPGTHVVRSLQSGGEDMEWLGGLPLDVLLALRRDGALAEIRAVLGKGVDEITESAPNDFAKASEQVQQNLSAAFQDHRRALRDLTTKKWKFAGKDLAPYLIFGAIEFASKLTDRIPPGIGVVAAAASQLGIIPKVPDVVKAHNELSIEGKRLKRSPFGILFNAKDSTRKKA